MSNNESDSEIMMSYDSSDSETEVGVGVGSLPSTSTNNGELEESKLTKTGKPRKPFVMTDARKAALLKAQAARARIKVEKVAKKTALKKQEKLMDNGVLVDRNELDSLREMVKELAVKKKKKHDESGKPATRPVSQPALSPSIFF